MEIFRKWFQYPRRADPSTVKVQHRNCLFHSSPFKPANSLTLHSKWQRIQKFKKSWCSPSLWFFGSSKIGRRFRFGCSSSCIRALKAAYRFAWTSSILIVQGIRWIHEYCFGGSRRSFAKDEYAHSSRCVTMHYAHSTFVGKILLKGDNITLVRSISWFYVAD